MELILIADFDVTFGDTNVLQKSYEKYCNTLVITANCLTFY